MVNSLSDLVYLPADFIVCSGTPAAQADTSLCFCYDSISKNIVAMPNVEVIPAASSFLCGAEWQATCKSTQAGFGARIDESSRVPISALAGVYPSGPECPPVWGESSEVAAARLVSRRVVEDGGRQRRERHPSGPGPCILRNTRPASTSVSSGCLQHAREQHGLWPRHIASFQRLGCRNEGS